MEKTRFLLALLARLSPNSPVLKARFLTAPLAGLSASSLSATKLPHYSAVG
jgi:hypothetical protein